MQGQKEIVAAVLTSQNNIAIFQRSSAVTGDRGKWHCITGFLPEHADPFQHAILEINEEADIGFDQLSLQGQKTFTQTDRLGTTWTVHAYHFESLTKTVNINWEHNDCRWVRFESLQEFPTVSWLNNVLSALSGTMFNVQNIDYDLALVS
jgi:hypothetical protein